MSLYKEHVLETQRRYESIMSEFNYDAVYIAAGTHQYYFLDDRTVPFHPNPHFSHWGPIQGSGHLLEIVPGEKPHLIFYLAKDFWHDKVEPEDSWADCFKITIVDDLGQIAKNTLPQPKNSAYISQFVASPPIPLQQNQNPELLLAGLHWLRGLKTPYEVECISEANALSSQGHKAARDMFLNSESLSELELHQAFMQAVGQSEFELPYKDIITLNEKAAVLHYEKFRKNKVKPLSFLIDAGIAHLGYASDISRTYNHPQNGLTIFAELIKKMDTIQQEVCATVKEGVSFLDLQRMSHQKTTDLLIDSGILVDCTASEAMEMQLTHVFCPHGLGHMLGIQVHDVSGKQEDPQGTPSKPCPEFPFVRTLRALRSNEVLTIEPGLYFMKSLLDNIENSDKKRHINWPLVKSLLPLGGIRIEDNILVEKEGHKNLTRPHLP